MCFDKPLPNFSVPAQSCLLLSLFSRWEAKQNDRRTYKKCEAHRKKRASQSPGTMSDPMADETPEQTLNSRDNSDIDIRVLSCRHHHPKRLHGSANLGLPIFDVCLLWQSKKIENWAPIMMMKVYWHTQFLIKSDASKSIQVHTVFFCV